MKRITTLVLTVDCGLATVVESGGPVRLANPLQGADPVRGSRVATPIRPSRCGFFDAGKAVGAMVHDAKTRPPDACRSTGRDGVEFFQKTGWVSHPDLYQVCPCTTEDQIGSPPCDRAMIHLPNGKGFVVNANANGAQRPYIRKATLNGADFIRTFLRHPRIVGGRGVDL